MVLHRMIQTIQMPEQQDDPNNPDGTPQDDPNNPDGTAQDDPNNPDAGATGDPNNLVVTIEGYNNNSLTVDDLFNNIDNLNIHGMSYATGKAFQLKKEGEEFHADYYDGSDSYSTKETFASSLNDYLYFTGNMVNKNEDGTLQIEGSDTTYTLVDFADQVQNGPLYIMGINLNNGDTFSLGSEGQVFHKYYIDSSQSTFSDGEFESTFANYLYLVIEPTAEEGQPPV